MDIKNIADDEVVLVPVKECNEPLIDLKEQNIISYGKPPDSPLTANDYTKVRTTIYKKLCLAQKELPDKWRFRLYEGYRSMYVQALLFEQQCNYLKASKKYSSYDELFKDSCRLISPVKLLDGTTNLPPHCTGGAIDIEIVDDNGELVDFGMAIKDWMNVDPDLCETYSTKVSDEAMSNRVLLLEIMSGFDFVNYPREWWHFSFGDRLWAYLSKKPCAIYGGL